MPRPDVSDQRKPQIIAAAARVFARDGFHSATMPQIAAEAGLSIGGLYWYFKSKQAMVTAILAQLFDADLEALRQLLAAQTPAAERIARFAQHLAALFDEHQWLMSVGVELYGVAAHDEQARTFVRRYLERYRETLATLIAQGVARREFRPVDHVAAANALLALGEGLALIWVADTERVAYKQSLALGVDLLLAGMELR